MVNTASGRYRCAHKMVYEIKGSNGDRRQQDAIIGLLSARKYNGGEFKCMYPQLAGRFSRRLIVFGVRPVEIFGDKQIRRSIIETGGAKVVCQDRLTDSRRKLRESG